MCGLPIDLPLNEWYIILDSWVIYYKKGVQNVQQVFSSKGTEREGWG